MVLMNLYDPFQDDFTATSSPNRSTQPHGSVVSPQRLRPDSTTKAHVPTEAPDFPDSPTSQINDRIVGPTPELVADPQRFRTDFTPPAIQHPCSQDPAPQRLSSSPKSGIQHPLDVVGSPQRPRSGNTTTPPEPLPAPSPVQESDSRRG